MAAAAVLVAAMRSLDNSLRAILREINEFDTKWQSDRRKQLTARVNEFATDEKILPIVRQYAEQLSSMLVEAHLDDRADAQEVLECAKGVLAALGDSVVTPFPDTTALRSFLSHVKNAKTSLDVQSTVAQADSVLAVVERNVLAKADLAFGRLKGHILLRHTELPDLGWSVALGLK